MRCIVLMAALLIVGCSTGEQASEPITITFGPGDSTNFVVRLAMTREMNQAGVYSKDSTWTRTEHDLVARGNGYELTGMTDSIVMFHNDSAMTDPLVHLFSRANITYVIDSSGEAIDVVGYEEVFRALDTLVGPDTAAAVRQMVSPEVLRGQEISTWNQKFMPYVGLTLTVGVPQIDSTVINLPIEGQVTMYELVELVGVEDLGSKPGVHLRISNATDPSELARISEHALDEIVELFSLTEEMVTRLSQREAGSFSLRDWFIESETMLSHKETLRQEIFFSELAQSGVPVRNNMSETHTKTYAY